MQAARKFTEVNPELGASYNNVIAPQVGLSHAGLSYLRIALKILCNGGDLKTNRKRSQRDVCRQHCCPAVLL